VKENSQPLPAVLTVEPILTAWTSKSALIPEIASAETNSPPPEPSVLPKTLMESKPNAEPTTPKTVWNSRAAWTTSPAGVTTISALNTPSVMLSPSVDLALKPTPAF